MENSWFSAFRFINDFTHKSCMNVPVKVLYTASMAGVTGWPKIVDTASACSARERPLPGGGEKRTSSSDKYLGSEIKCTKIIDV